MSKTIIFLALTVFAGIVAVVAMIMKGGMDAAAIAQSALNFVNDNSLMVAGLVSKVIPWIFPVILAYAAYKLGLIIYGIVQDNWVEGSPNEWVLKIRDGKQIDAQLGYQGYKMPWDVVAKFPSGVREVNFNAMQVTEEMQGLDVKATLAWTINKVEDGPFKAYKNLGSDIKSANPRATNEKITGMAQAIVRQVIANNTLDDVIKNRDLITSRMEAELKPVLAGWGMWLERIDIKDVRICSGSIFSDLQALTKHTQSMEASMKKETAANNLAKKRLDQDLIDCQRNQDQQEVKVKNECRMRTQALEKECQAFDQTVKLGRRQKEREIQKQIFDMEQAHNLSLVNLESGTKKFETEQNNEIALKKSKQESIKQAGKIALETKQQELDLKKSDDAKERERKKEKYNLTKEIYADPKLLDMEYLRAQKTIYKRYVQSSSIHQMDGKDPFATQLKSFVKSAMEGSKEQK